MKSTNLAFTAAVLALCAGASGCVSPQHSLNPDWGMANRSFLAAQKADPDARYARELNPASSGPRAADASRRYNRGEVIQPMIETTSSTIGGASAPSAGGSASPSSR